MAGFVLGTGSGVLAAAAVYYTISSSISTSTSSLQSQYASPVPPYTHSPSIRRRAIPIPSSPFRMHPLTSPFQPACTTPPSS